VRVVAALVEKDLEYELIVVNLTTGAHKHPDFLALNPFGQIPVLQDGDITLFESRAITKYIAKKHAGIGPDLLGSATPAAAAAVEVWLEVEAHQFGPHISAVVYELLIKPKFGGATDLVVVEAEAAKLAKVLDVYEARLASSKYIAGDEFSLADLHHAPYINYLMKTVKAELITSRPHVKAWWEEISARPAWKKTAATITI